MFPNLNLNELYIIGPATIIIGCLFFILRAKIIREPDSLKRAFKLYELFLGATAALVMVVWFTIPSTSTLKTSSYPESVAAIKSPEELLTILQTYNSALVRTAAALRWFLLIFVAVLLLNTYRFCRTSLNILTERYAETGRK